MWVTRLVLCCAMVISQRAFADALFDTPHGPVYPLDGVPPNEVGPTPDYEALVSGTLLGGVWPPPFDVYVLDNTPGSYNVNAIASSDGHIALGRVFLEQTTHCSAETSATSTLMLYSLPYGTRNACTYCTISTGNCTARTSKARPRPTARTTTTAIGS